MPKIPSRPVPTAWYGLATVLAVAGCAGEPRPSADPEAVFSRLSPGIVLSTEEPPAWSLAERMERASAPAVVVTLVDSSGLAWTHAAGVLRAGSEGAVRAQTRFPVKSLSKPVTAFAALRLVDQGVLDLDAPLDTYLERWSVPDNEFTRATAPTLRHLLAHRAGFTMWGVPSYAPGEPRPTLAEILHGDVPEDYAPVTIDFEPGTDSRYSGGGYSVLQLLLEDVTRESFPNLMRRLVLDPIGMEHSLFHPGVPDSLADETAAGHEDGEPRPHWDALVQMAAGGLLSTAPDMGRFVAEVNRAARGASGLLSTELAREMLHDQGAGRGLGFEVEGTGDALAFSHTGSGDGFRTLLLGLPARSEGLVVFVSSDDPRSGELRHEIVRAAALVAGWPGLGPEVRAVADVDPAWLDRLAGRYEYSDGSVTTVSASAGGLHAAWGDADPVRIFPSDSLRWFTRSGERFTFEAEEGSASALEWSGSFGAFRAQRLP
ncbi:MAG: serine hydrolase domain-containing protein [Gemmatimonadota bacterium]